MKRVEEKFNDVSEFTPYSKRNDDLDQLKQK
jgi:hypothetical protein